MSDGTQHPVTGEGLGPAPEGAPPEPREDVRAAADAEEAAAAQEMPYAAQDLTSTSPSPVGGEKRRIIANTLANGGAQAISLLASLVFFRLLTNSFGNVNYGIFLTVTTVAQYSQLLDFGVGASLVKMIAEHLARDDREGIGPLTSAALAFYLVIGVVIAAAMVLLAFTDRFVFPHFSADSLQLMRNMLFVAAAFSLWQWPANTFLYVLNGFQRYTLTARVQVGITLANIVVYIGVLRFHQGPLVLFIGTSLVLVAGSALNIVLARGLLDRVRVSPFLASRAHLIHIFSFSWAIFLVQFSTVILYQQTDRMVIAIFLGAGFVTLYEAAGKFMGLIMQLVAFANSAVIPMASHLDAAGEKEKLRLLFLRGSKYATALVAPVIVVLMVLARPILAAWMIKPQFVAMALDARILIFPQMLIVGGTVGDSIIIGTGALKRRLPYSLAMTFGNLVLSLLLVRPLGIMGVVLGTAIPYLIDFPIHIWWLLRELDVPARRWWAEVVAPVYPLLVVPIGVSVAGLFSPLAGSLLGIALIGAVSCGAYFAGMFAVGLTGAERDDVRGFLSGVRGRFAR